MGADLGSKQIIWGNAQSIATSYPWSQRGQYAAAATTLRIPYWDWAFNATMPDIVSLPKITINTPTGSQSVSNPFYNYSFHPIPPASQFPSGDALSKYQSTVRYPDANGNSQPGKVNQQLQANAEALRDMTYQLIASQSDYAPFSNTGYTDSRGNTYNSIENMHNGIHALVGNGGHVSVPTSNNFFEADLNVDGGHSLLRFRSDFLATSCERRSSDCHVASNLSRLLRQSRSRSVRHVYHCSWDHRRRQQPAHTIPFRRSRHLLYLEHGPQHPHVRLHVP